MGKPPFLGGRDSLPILALLFYFGSPHRIVCETGKLPRHVILLWAVKEIAKISLFPYCSLPNVKSKSFIDVCCLHFFWLWKQKAPNLFLLNSEFIGYSKLLVGGHIGFFTDRCFSSSTAVKGPFIRALSYAQQSFWRWRGGEVWKVILSMAFTEYVSLLGGHLGFSEGLINQN